MRDAVRIPAYVLGTVSIGSALRRVGDLGELVGPGAFWWLLGLGSALVVAASRPARSAELDRRRAAALALGGAACLLATDALAGALAAAGLLGAAVMLVERTRGAAARIADLALLLVLSSACVYAVDQLALLRAPGSLLATALATLLSAFGADVAASDDLLIVKGLLSDLGFRLAPHTLGAAVHAAIAVQFVALAWVGANGAGVLRESRRALSYLALACALRFLLAAATSISLESTREYDDEHFPLEPLLDWRFGLAFDALAALAAAAATSIGRPTGTSPTPSPEAEMNVEPTSLRRLIARPLPALGIALAAGVLLASDRVFDCTGELKRGRIAIDEGHSQWEATDLRLGRDTYGAESGYNYRAVVDWLETGYGPVRRLYDEITPASLREFDVLIVKTPTAAFAPDEIAAIHGWVRDGGGLILIGDHTNVFGTGSILNEIALPLGFHFDFDCVFDHRRRFEQFHRVDPALAAHPVLRPLSGIRFEVGCSIDIDSSEVRSLLVGRGQKSQPIDYRVSNFYPRPQDQSHMRCGSFAQLVTRSFGKGRVLAISDSTLFSTFSIFIPGRRELVEGMVAYANRVDPGEGVRRAAKGLGWLLALVTLALAHGVGRFQAAAALLVVAGGSRAATAAAELWLYPGHPAPAPGKASREVWFHRSGIVDWPVERFVQDPQRTYDLFFQYAARTGQFPRLVSDLETCLAGDSPLVLIDPDETSTSAAAAIVGAARSGRSVLLLESRPNALVDAVAAECGFALTPALPGEVVKRLLTAHGPVHAPAIEGPGRVVEGGRPLLVEERVRGDGSESRRAVVGAVAKVGAGHVAILANGACFANAVYGFSYSKVPDRDLRRLYEFQFDLLTAMARSEPLP
jgi:hypothetical protein